MKGHKLIQNASLEINLLSILQRKSMWENVHARITNIFLRTQLMKCAKTFPIDGSFKVWYADNFLNLIKQIHGFHQTQSNHQMKVALLTQFCSASVFSQTHTNASHSS